MLQMFKGDKACTVDSLQIPAMKAAGWSTKKPKEVAKVTEVAKVIKVAKKVEVKATPKVEKKALKKTKKVINRLQSGTK